MYRIVWSIGSLRHIVQELRGVEACKTRSTVRKGLRQLATLLDCGLSGHGNAVGRLRSGAASGARNVSRCCEDEPFCTQTCPSQRSHPCRLTMMLPKGRGPSGAACITPTKRSRGQCQLEWLEQYCPCTCEEGGYTEPCPALRLRPLAVLSVKGNGLFQRPTMCGQTLLLSSSATFGLSTCRWTTKDGCGDTTCTSRALTPPSPSKT